MKILLAEDDRDMAKGISVLLTRNNITVDAVYSGTDALDYILQGDYDAAVLDIMMPSLSGIEVVKELRKKGLSIPVLFLTAKGEVEDRIDGLNAGADDYLPKPFDGRELLARVRSLLRRSQTFTPDVTEAGDLKLDRSTFQLSCGNKHVSLNNKSFQMMEMLMVGKGRIISVDEFMEHIWGWNSESEINVVWVNISSLRKHLLSLKSAMQIRAIRGAGYVLEERHD